MKFHIINVGDPSVGIQAYETEATIPNTEGADSEDWIAWCKDFLTEMYGQCTRAHILTEEEYADYILLEDQ